MKTELPSYFLLSNLNLPSTSNVYTYMLQHKVLQLCENVACASFIHRLDCLTKLNSRLALAPPNVNRLIHISFSVIIHSVKSVRSIVLNHKIRNKQLTIKHNFMKYSYTHMF